MASISRSKDNKDAYLSEVLQSEIIPMVFSSRFSRILETSRQKLDFLQTGIILASTSK